MLRDGSWDLNGLISGVGSLGSLGSLGTNQGIVIIGGGPAGCKAAVEAASMGVKVTMIDPAPSISGLPTGAYSKCLREAGKKGAKSWDEVSSVLESALALATAKTSRELKMFHVSVLRGTAKIHSDKSVLFTPVPKEPTARVGRTTVLGLKFANEGGGLLDQPDPYEIKFDTLIIATGSKGSRRGDIQWDKPGVYDSDTIKSIGRIPKRLVVQGAGIIGLEYALIFKMLGCPSVIVTLRGDAVVPTLDPSLQKACKTALVDSGIELGINTTIKSVEGLGTPEDDLGGDCAPRVRVTFSKGNTVECDAFLSATGRGGATAGLGLEKIEAIKVTRDGYISVDANGLTGAKNIYAVGDITGAGLATIGQIQAQQAIWHRYNLSNGSKESIAMTVLPKAVWSVPEFSWVGMTEQDAKAAGVSYGTVTIDYQQTIRGCVQTHTQGFLKMLFLNEGGRILGVHMFGEASADHINFGADLVQDQTTVHQLQQFVFPAVTFHELYHQAAVEASLRMRHSASKDLSAATAWNRVTYNIQRQAALKGVAEEVVVKEAFQAFDADGSGFVSKAELKAALKCMDLEVDDDVIRKMVMEAIHTEQGIIDYESFFAVCSNTDAGIAVSPEAVF